MSRVTNTEAEKLIAELRAAADGWDIAVAEEIRLYGEGTEDAIGMEERADMYRSAAALIESQREDRDSWRRVAERLEEEKRAAEARVTALEAEMAGAVADEREACAALLEKMARDRSEAMTGQWHTPDMNIAWRNGATAIRARQALCRSSTEVKKDG